MIKYNRYQLIYSLMGLIALLTVYACANITSLTGGDKDTIPPKISTEKTTPNFQTRFTDNKITFIFNEWITLKDKSQIIISPPLEFNPEIKSKGKEVTITFNEKEILKANTTYVIQLGQSIVDFTEGNVIKGYSHVFSTGDYIDSLSIGGSVIDAFTEKPVASIAIMLFESAEDSVIYLERPYYLALTNEQGEFKLNNIKEGEFRLIALEDNNLNFTFDPTSEKIGFIDTLITIDTNFISYNKIKIFNETQAIKLQTFEHDKNGLITLVFNQSIDSINFNFSDSINYIEYLENEKQLIWYSWDTTRMELYVLEDTIKIKHLKQSVDTILHIKGTQNISKKGKTKGIHPSSPISLDFRHPIISIDTNLIQLLDTSKTAIKYHLTIDTIDHRKLHIISNWEENKTYNLTIFPNAISDFFHYTNDTIMRSYSISPLDDFGTILLHLSKIDSVYNYFLELKQGEQVITNIIIEKGDTSFQYQFKNLREGDYDIILIEDRDENKKWSPGNYLNKTHAEKIATFKTGRLRKNWDLDVEYEFYPLIIKKEIQMSLDSIQADSLGLGYD